MELLKTVGILAVLFVPLGLGIVLANRYFAGKADKKVLREKPAGTPEEKITAQVFCSGGADTKKRFSYVGIPSCLAADRLAGGPTECTYACLGYGDCMKVCETQAISIRDGHACVDRSRCTGCGRCVSVCPRNVIGMVPDRTVYTVNCASRERGGYVRTVCEEGCVGCTLCAQKCPAEAVMIKDNLAQIDYEKCTGCGICAEVCPRKVILKG